MSLRRKGQRLLEAFTLLEVVFSMTLVSLLFVTVYGGMATGFTLVNTAREDLRANQILVEKMETLRLYSWDQVNSNGYIPATFTAPFFPGAITNVVDSGGTNTTNTTSFSSTGITYYGKLAIADAPFTNGYSTNLRLVTLTLAWTNSGALRSRKLSTLVSRSGLQNYVYY